MRTKALILSAVFCAIGAASVVAADVYSVNVVGYTTVTVNSPTNFVLIGNQLTDNNGDYATNHIPTAPAGTQLYKYNPVSGIYDIMSRTPAAWSGATAMTISPGDGVFLKRPPLQPTLTITFVGEVMQTATHDMTIDVRDGFNIYSAVVPQQGAITAVHQYAPVNGDQVYRFNAQTGTYLPASYNGTRWLPADPVLNVNEAVWIKSIGAKSWVRVFDVE